jgi:curved DNA-binding protein CbpA
MSTVNWYDVLNVEQDCTQEEIKKSYRKLVLKYHPDQPDGDPDLFELINDAYQVIGNIKNRKDYDEAYNITSASQVDHQSLKGNFENYKTGMKTSILAEDKETAKINYNKDFDDFDAKHGYNRNIEKNAIDVSDAENMVMDLEQTRKDDDIETLPQELFYQGVFDPAKFNEAWDKMNNGPSEMIPHEGNPNAFIGDNATYTSLEAGYDKLYDDGELESDSFGPVKFTPLKSNKLTSKDVEKMSGAKYYDKHDKLDMNYSKTLEEKMREREEAGNTFSKMSIKDFNQDSSMGGYGIFDSIGLPQSTIGWDNENEDDLKKKYNKLLEMRASKK